MTTPEEIHESVIESKHKCTIHFFREIVLTLQLQNNIKIYTQLTLSDLNPNPEETDPTTVLAVDEEASQTDQTQMEFNTIYLEHNLNPMKTQMIEIFPKWSGLHPNPTRLVCYKWGQTQPMPRLPDTHLKLRF